MLLSIRLCQHVLNLTPCDELENSGPSPESLMPELFLYQ